MANLEIPVNPDVVKWAIDESGYTRCEIAKRLKIDESIVSSWESGASQPSVGQLTRLASILKRQRLLFFREDVPEGASLSPDLRTMERPDGGRLELSPQERLAIRRAKYLQETLADLVFKDEQPKVEVPRHSSSDHPESAGASIREWVDSDEVSVPIGREFKEWRGLVESRGVFVMSLQLTRQPDQEPFNLRGFSLANDYAPVVAVISADHQPARSFTLFHELAHLSTDNDVSCHVPRPSARGVEMWCDRVASAALIPRQDLSSFVSDEGFSMIDEAVVNGVASRYRTSKRAAAVALEDSFDHARGIYAQVDAATPWRDHPSRSGGGGGATRPQIRVRQLGHRAVATFLQAFADRRISEIEIRRKLGIEGPEIDAAAIQVGVDL